MNTQEVIFWVAVGLAVVTLLLWFGGEIITNMLSIKVSVNP